MTAFALPEPARWLGRPPLRVETGLHGHVLVLVAWRRGDAHGRAAMVELALLAAAMHDAPVACLSVHVGEDHGGDAALAAWLAQLPVPIPTAVVADGAWLRECGGRAAPFLFVVDALGDVRGASAGVPRRARLQAAVQALLGEPVARGRAPDVPFVPHAPFAMSSGASAVLAADDGVWLALPQRRQVAAFSRDGDLLRLFGSGRWGSRDGPAAEARFALPVALSAHGSSVVVSDSGNHTLRVIDRERGEVATLCGTGRLGADRIGGGYGRDQSLHSPAGAVSREGGLYVAHAGAGQLWQVDPMTGAAMSWLDGFDEPYGVAIRADSLWVADPVRGEVFVVDLAHVEKRVVAAMRRPVAVAAHGAFVFVADEQARQVWRFDAATGSGRVVLDEAAGLRGPGALSVHGGDLHMVDGGRWLVSALDPDGAPGEPCVVELRGLPAPVSPFEAPLARVARGVEVAAHSDVTVRVRTRANATCRVDIVDEAAPTLAVARHATAEPQDGVVEVLAPVAEVGEGAWRVRVLAGPVCECHVLPVAVRAGGGAAVVELGW